MAASTDGSYVVTGGLNKYFCVWNAYTLSLIFKRE